MSQAKINIKKLLSEKQAERNRFIASAKDDSDAVRNTLIDERYYLAGLVDGLKATEQNEAAAVAELAAKVNQTNIDLIEQTESLAAALGE